MHVTSIVSKLALFASLIQTPIGVINNNVYYVGCFHAWYHHHVSSYHHINVLLYRGYSRNYLTHTQNNNESMDKRSSFVEEPFLRWQQVVMATHHFASNINCNSRVRPTQFVICWWKIFIKITPNTNDELRFTILLVSRWSIVRRTKHTITVW